MNRFMKFCRLGWSEKVLFCESLILHLFVGLLLKVVPFRRIPPLFKSKQSAVSSQQSGTPAKTEDQSRYTVPGQQEEIIEKIRLAVQRAGWISPWRNRCLVSSLAGRCMLRRRKISSELSLGVAKNSAGKLVAHAWLKSGHYELVEKRGEYTELYNF